MPLVHRATYTELVATGRLALLRDDTLRGLLENFEASHNARARLDLFNEFLPAVFAPLEEHRRWLIGNDSDFGADCSFDLAAMSADPRMPSLLAQIHRKEVLHQRFARNQLDAVLALRQRLSQLGIQGKE